MFDYFLNRLWHFIRNRKEVYITYRLDDFNRARAQLESQSISYKYDTYNNESIQYYIYVNKSDYIQANSILCSTIR